MDQENYKRTVSIMESDLSPPQVVSGAIEDWMAQYLVAITKFSKQLFSGPLLWIFHSHLHL